MFDQNLGYLDRIIRANGIRAKNKIYYDYLWKIYLRQNSIPTPRLESISADQGEIYQQKQQEEYIDYRDVDVVWLSEQNIKENVFNKISGYKPKERNAYFLDDCTFFSGLAIPYYNRQYVLEPFGGDINSFLEIKRITETKGYFDNNISLREEFSNKYRNISYGKECVEDQETSSYTIFPLVHWYQSYYHWVIDYLPKLRILDIYEKETGNKPKILIREDAAGYRKESLELLGYSEDRILEWRDNDCIKSCALFTNHRKNPWEHSRQDYNWLRENILDKVICGDKTNNNNNNKRIYISRQGQKDNKNIHNNERSVINFQPFRDLIESHGFRVIRAENYTIAEQVKIFNSADVIMSPHGAGLTNMVFAKDPLVIELFPDSFVIPLYSYLCDTLKFEYLPIVVDSNDRNLVVGLGYFDNILSSIPGFDRSSFNQ